MPAPQSRYRQPKQLDAAGFQPEISSFRLYLAAGGKAGDVGPRRGNDDVAVNGQSLYRFG